MKKQKIQFVAMILVLCLMIGEGYGMQFARAAETRKEYSGDGYQIAVVVQSAWEDGLIAEVTVENTGSEAIRNWEVVSRFSGGTIANQWNTDIIQNENSCIFKCLEFNRVIEAGESVTFGYQMENGGIDAVEDMALVQKEVEEKNTEDYSVSYRIVNEWDRHAVIEAEISNHTGHDLEDWQVVFDYDVTITNIWNAEIIQNSGAEYTIRNKDYNAVIPANDKAGFGFEVEFPDETICCPSNSVIRGVSDINKTEEGRETEVPATMKPPVETETSEEFDPEEDAYVYHDIENRDWNMEMINADSDIVKEAQKHPKGTIRVALLDSGINYSDEVYVSERKNFVPGQDDYSELYEDVSGHGTAIAEILASNPYGTPVELSSYNDEDENQYTYYEKEQAEPGKGQEDVPDDKDDGETTLLDILDSGYEWNQGLDPSVDLVSAKVLDEENKTTVERVVKAVDWAIEKDADIISMSFGMKEDSPKLHKAIKRAEDAGILMIAAAGNEEEVEYPAAYEEVMAVGAVDSMAKKAEQSAEGEELEVVAPGEFVISRGAFDSMQIFSGTSMAVPHVTGLASLLWQKDASKPADFIRQLIGATARECGPKYIYGHGLIDCEYALEKYGEFETLYKEAEKRRTDDGLADRMENTEVIDTDEEVRSLYGSWIGDEHEAFVTSYTDEKSNNTIWKKFTTLKNILKKGVTFVDDKANKDCQGMAANPWFHGYYGKDEFNKNLGKRTVSSNYIASYQYLYMLAEGMYRDGRIHFAGTDSPAFMDNVELKNAYEGINAAFTDDNRIGSFTWEEICADCKKAPDGTVPKKERSLLVFGMALHTLTDTYAHSSFCRNKDKKNKIIWKAITHKKLYCGIRESDSPKYIEKRYTDAKASARELMGKIKVDSEHGFMGFKSSEQALSVFLKPAYTNLPGGKKTIDIGKFNKAYALKLAYKYAGQLGGVGNNKAEMIGKVKNRLEGITLGKIKEKLEDYKVFNGKVKKKKNQAKKMKYELLDGGTGNKLIEIDSDTGSFSVLIAKDSQFRMVEKQDGGTPKICCTFSEGSVFDADGRKISEISDDSGEDEEPDEEDLEEMCEIYPFEYDVKQAAYRIELSWDDKTVDLDSMLCGTYPDDEYFYMTYFVEKTYHPELADVFQKDGRAEIVKDVKDGSEAEITKLYQLERGYYYYFLVRNFSGRSPGELSDSGATVKVYKNDAVMPISVYEVPKGQGYFWQPFCILGDSGTIVPVNMITNEAFGYEPEGEESDVSN